MQPWIRVAAVSLCAGVAGAVTNTALAHDGAGHRLSAYWEADPLVLAVLLGLGVLYARGLTLLWRSSKPGTGIRRWEAACYAGGWMALALALLSPLHSVGELLFSVHMTQHEVLMLVAAPLIVLGRPLLPVMWALPAEWLVHVGSWTRAPTWRQFWRVLIHPITAWIIHFAILWAWHAPVLFSAAVRNNVVHDLQHVSFFGSALLFWWAVLHGGYGRVGYGTAILYVATTAFHNSALGALLTYAEELWYPVYALTAPQWGITALEDQQLGGLIMWVPAGLVYIVAICLLAAAWLKESERRIQRKEAGAAKRP